MTTERKAELRRLAEAASQLAYRGSEGCRDMTCTRNLADESGCYGWHCSFCQRPCGNYQGHACMDRILALVAACNAIPELLDELEEVEAQRKHYIGEFDHASFYRDSMARQVAVLQEALETWRRIGRGMLGTYRCPYCGTVPPAKHISHDCALLRQNAATETLLADTEAAATTWLETDRREQRLAGARALLDRLETADFDDRAFYQATQRLEAMESEHDVSS